MATGRVETKKSPTKKPSNGSVDLVVMVQVQGADGQECPMSFQRHAINSTIGVTPEQSLIRLMGGEVIPVAMPYPTLIQKLYAPDEGEEDVLNLSEVTGAAVENPVLLTPALPRKDEPLKIRALLRKPNSDDTAVYEFQESDIRSVESLGTKRSKCGESVSIYFNKAARPMLSSDNGQANLDMPYDEYATLRDKAKREGKGTLDLYALFLLNRDKYGNVPQ